MFPRSSSAFITARSAPEKENSFENYKPSFLVNQHNLKDLTKLKLYYSPRKPSSNFNELNFDDKDKKSK